MNATETKMALECEKGHENTFYIHENMGTEDQPCGESGEFATGEQVKRVPLDSYAYANGGCCYRAAVETLHGRHVFTPTRQ